jgi:P4 family phage/plasmid primase-like protien
MKPIAGKRFLSAALSSAAGGGEPPDDDEPLPNPYASTINYLPSAGGETTGPQKLTARMIQMDLLRQYPLMTDRPGNIWYWNKIHWTIVPERQVGAWLMTYDHADRPSRSRQNEALDFALKAVYADPIPWRQLDPLEVPVLNGVVNVESCEVRPHCKEDYLETVVPHAYVPTALHTRWLQALAEWFDGDPEGEQKILALQEFFGYILLPHTRYKKALFMWGDTDTGKSVVADVIQALVGAQNRCTISTEEMADPRKREDIVGKLVNVLSELPTDALIQDAGFKQLVSTGDAIAIDPKYKARYSYVPVCKHVIACNVLPEINDHTRATTNRLLIVKFHRRIEKKAQDSQLLAKLSTELPGILAWAVEGAARLVEQGGEFTQIEESTQIIQEYRDESNPINAFLEEHTDEHTEGLIEVPELRERFNKWSGFRYGRKKIGMLLTAAGFPPTPGSVRGRPVRVIRGRVWVSSQRGW